MQILLLFLFKENKVREVISLTSWEMASDVSSLGVESWEDLRNFMLSSGFTCFDFNGKNLSLSYLNK